MCEFCNMNVETNKHLFWECIHTQHFWAELSGFLKTKNMNIDFNYETISFGLTKGMQNPNTKLKNYIILCAKYFIFVNKCRNTTPSLNYFKTYLNKQIDIEKQIAQEKDKLESHNMKWSLFSNIA